MTLTKAISALCLLVVLGLGVTACDTIGPMFGQYKNEITALVNANAAGTYVVTFTKDGKTLHTESWTCKAVEGKLPVCHMDAAATLSTDVTAPPVPVK